MKNASFQTILDDLKISIRFASKNIISFILALFGVIIISAILLVIVAILIFVPLFFILGIEGVIAFFTTLTLNFPAGFTSILVAGLLIAIPLVAPFFVAIGALFGMGREIVESEGTSLEGVFTWYRKKFFSLAGGGIMLFIIVLGPFIVFLLAGIAIFGFDFFNFTLISIGTSGIFNPIIGVLLTLWFSFSLGLLSMLFPAIIDGYSAIEATKKSIRMSLTYFDRIFGVWLSYLLVLGACVLPMLLMPFVMDLSLVVSIVLGVIAVPLFLFLIFIFLPSLTIGLTRVYMILTADDDYEESPQENASGPSFVGGL
jgi:hypothetical protein